MLINGRDPRLNVSTVEYSPPLNNNNNTLFRQGKPELHRVIFIRALLKSKGKEKENIITFEKENSNLLASNLDLAYSLISSFYFNCVQSRNKK